MPKDKYNPEPAKTKPTRHERRLYNQYTKRALRTGENVLGMQKWLQKQRKGKD